MNDKESTLAELTGISLRTAIAKDLFVGVCLQAIHEFNHEEFIELAKSSFEAADAFIEVMKK